MKDELRKAKSGGLTHRRKGGAMVGLMPVAAGRRHNPQARTPAPLGFHRFKTGKNV